MLSAILQEVKRFREKIYGAIRYRRDATFEMIDALCSNVTAQSPIALSLNSHHRRGYASITDVLSEFHKGGETQSSDLLSGLMEEALHSRAGQPYFLCATDATPAPRAYSPTLADRTFVYQPNPTVPGNKPVTIGHKYISVCCLQSPADTWVLPLSVVRVPSAESDIDLGAKQLREVLAMLRQQAPDKPVVSCVDSAYSTPEYIHSIHGGAGTDNLLTITRLRSNRVLWQKASEKRSVYGNKRGHDRWYGARFSLKDERTWHPPDETHRISSTTKRGKGMLTVIQRWNNLLRRDKRGLPMHLYPFTLLRVVVTMPKMAGLLACWPMPCSLSPEMPFQKQLVLGKLISRALEKRLN